MMVAIMHVGADTVIDMVGERAFPRDLDFFAQNWWVK
jgi:hypothetical protein